VRARSDLVPRVGLVLGSGLGGIAELVADAVTIPFAELPGWPAASAPGHVGRLLLGRLEDVPVACLQGRLHMYEGLDALQVIEPALLMSRLGARVLVLTNASGGVDPGFEAGTLMLVTDHLNLTGRSPLFGPNDDTLGPRFLDLTEVYDPELRGRVRAAADAEGVALAEGVYAGLTGPTYETPAEVRMLGVLGAHAVGMSTVMEAIGARYVGMRVVAVSLVTNKGAGLSATPLTHDEVLVAANEVGPRLARVLARFIRGLPSEPQCPPHAARRA
jgi:purine-nucleoside phosphorylase